MKEKEPVNVLCEKCLEDCKQSKKCVVITCRKFHQEDKESKQDIK